MSEMVERVAKAMVAGLIPLDDDFPPGANAADVLAALHARAPATARAVLAALREPTDAMCEAGKRSDALEWSLEPGEGLDDFNVAVAWQAMIDAALK